jgi:hypothetical protein
VAKVHEKAALTKSAAGYGMLTDMNLKTGLILYKVQLVVLGGIIIF